MVRTILSPFTAVVALAATGATTRPATAAAATDRGAAAKQPVRLGYYDGATVRSFDFGPIELKPGNEFAPIWTNGAAGRRNIAPGRTAYRPLV